MGKINKPILIGIAGGSGSGKTLVAQRLFQDIGSDRVAFIQQDSYYKDRSHLPPAEREKIKFDHPDAVDSDIRFIRRLKRDISERGRTVESVIQQYEDTVRPMHQEFVEPTKRFADIIIPEGGYNLVAIDVLKSKLRALLKRDILD